MKYFEYIEGLIKSELNVKEVFFVHADDLEDEIVYIVKPNFSTLGKRCGKKLPQIKAALSILTGKEINLLKDGNFLEIDGEKIYLNDVIIEMKATDGKATATDGNIVVILDTVLTQELINEGLAREISHSINEMRRNKLLEINQRIDFVFDTGSQDI